MNISGYEVAFPLLLGVGVVLCLFGALVYRFSTTLAGAWVGAFAMGGVGTIVTAMFVESADARIIGGAMGALLGVVIGIWIVRKLTRMGIGLLGALTGLGIGRVIAGLVLGSEVMAQPLLQQPAEAFMIMMAGAVIGGLLALFNQGILLMILTSLMGAAMINAAFEPFPPPWMFLVVAGVSALWQVYSSWFVRRRPTRDEA